MKPKFKDVKKKEKSGKVTCYYYDLRWFKRVLGSNYTIQDMKIEISKRVKSKDLRDKIISELIFLNRFDTKEKSI